MGQNSPNGRYCQQETGTFAEHDELTVQDSKSTVDEMFGVENESRSVTVFDIMRSSQSERERQSQ